MKNTHFLEVALIALTMVFFSCSKDNNNPEENDEDIGIEVNLRNANNGGGYITLYDFGNNCNIYLKIDNSDNFILSSNYFGSSGPFHDIVCVGRCSGLGQINSIPKNGWSDKSAVRENFGYIIRAKDLQYSSSFIYARVYVMRYLISTDGGIIGATIRYQPYWSRED